MPVSVVRLAPNVRMHEHLHDQTKRPGHTTPKKEMTLRDMTTAHGSGPLTPPVTDQLVWRKSTVSNPSGSCVELAKLPDGGMAMRNSRCPAGPRLVYTKAEAAAFVRGVRAGGFDDLLS